MKIFDAFTFWVEFDLLELRLSILDKYVDYFILVESLQTFSGHDKPLYYLKNKEKFAKWNDKIIHVVVPNIETNNLFERHYLCYEAIENKLIELGKPDDLSFCSDLDEVWNPEILNKVDDKIHSLGQLNYCYYLNMRSAEAWVGSLMSKIGNISVGYNKFNRTAKPNLLPNGGWHFTNMGGAEQIIKKIQAYDHASEVVSALSQFVDFGIQDRMDKNLDYLGRSLDYEGHPFDFYIDESEWPTYLKENKDRYQNLCK